MHNLYEQFRQLIPDPPLQAGTVIDVGSGVVTVALPGGGRIKARGSAAIGQKVFVRDDAIEGIEGFDKVINFQGKLEEKTDIESTPAPYYGPGWGYGGWGGAYWGGYGIGKHGLEGVFRILAQELEGSTVRVNAARPAPTRTNLRSRA